MSAETLARAPSGVTWDGINWADVQRQVRRLQARTSRLFLLFRRTSLSRWLQTEPLPASPAPVGYR